MFAKINGVGISEIVSVIPETKVNFVNTSDHYNLHKSKAIKLRDTFGFNERHVVTNTETSVDLAAYGLKYLLQNGLRREMIGAIVFVSQTPDYLLPGSSYLLHGAFELDEDVVCLDINSGCSGFVVGLFQAMQMVPFLEGKEVLLINADTLSKVTCDQDFKNHPMIGDGATITRVCQTQSANCNQFLIRGNGKLSDYIQVPAGGFRNPLSNSDRQPLEFSDGTKRARQHLTMNGAGIFKFTQTNVPTLIRDILTQTNLSVDDIDSFFLHQPNAFIVDKIVEELGISKCKVAQEVFSKFGNLSGASIPLTMCINDQKLSLSKRVCVAGFGVGLSWGAGILDMNNSCDTHVIEKPAHLSPLVEVF